MQMQYGKGMGQNPEGEDNLYKTIRLEEAHTDSKHSRYICTTDKHKLPYERRGKLSKQVSDTGLAFGLGLRI